MDYDLLAFSSAYAAIAAQKLLTDRVPFQVMPVLREISASCGIALRFAPDRLEEVRSILSGSALAPELWALYGVSGAGAELRLTALQPQPHRGV